MNIIEINELKGNIKSLAYAVVEQAFEDYTKDLQFIKQWKSTSYIMNYNVSNEFLVKIRSKFTTKKTDDELINLFKANRRLHLKQCFDELKEINKFIMSDWYETLCPIIDKRIAKNRLEEIENEILGDEIYLLN